MATTREDTPTKADTPTKVVTPMRADTPTKAAIPMKVQPEVRAKAEGPDDTLRNEEIGVIQERTGCRVGHMTAYKEETGVRVAKATEGAPEKRPHLAKEEDLRKVRVAETDKEAVVMTQKVPRAKDSGEMDRAAVKVAAIKGSAGAVEPVKAVAIKVAVASAAAVEEANAAAGEAVKAAVVKDKV